MQVLKTERMKKLEEIAFLCFSLLACCLGAGWIAKSTIEIQNIHKYGPKNAECIITNCDKMEDSCSKQNCIWNPAYKQYVCKQVTVICWTACFNFEIMDLEQNQKISKICKTLPTIDKANQFCMENQRNKTLPCWMRQREGVFESSLKPWKKGLKKWIMMLIFGIIFGLLGLTMFSLSLLDFLSIFIKKKQSKPLDEIHLSNPVAQDGVQL